MKEGDSMEPFTEATAGQLVRLIKIIDIPDSGINYDFFLRWVNGETPSSWLSTENVIADWETTLTKSWLNRNKGPTAVMIEYWERVIERGEDT